MPEPSQPPIIHGAENFSVSQAAEAIPAEERVAITREDLRPPEAFAPGTTLIAMVANVKDIRDPNDGEVGQLYPDQAAAFGNHIRDFMDELYNTVPEEEWNGIDVVVIAGDTRLVTPGPQGLNTGHQRAMDTGSLLMESVASAMTDHGLVSGDHFTVDGDHPIAVSHLIDVNMLHDHDNPHTQQYMDFMLDKYGAGREFWMAYEDDTDKEIREQLGVEGPSDIARRVSHIVDISAEIADLHRKDDPNRRVVVFDVGHYDNISPWVKEHILGLNPAESFVPVEKGGGLVIEKTADGKAQTHIGSRLYPVQIDPVAKSVI